MTLLSIFQLLLGLLILVLVTFQVKKDSSGLAGLMGNSNNNKPTQKVDKATKYMLIGILLFIFTSFGLSYQKSLTSQSVVNDSRIEHMKDK